jgi:hypothetical protein
MLLSALAGYINGVGGNYKTSTRNYKTKVRLGKDISMGIQILKFPNEEKYCFDFYRYQMDSISLSREFIKVKLYFGGLANAAL